jgi:RNA polymerase sigma-70 factor (subfamily 1)
LASSDSSFSIERALEAVRRGDRAGFERILDGEKAFLREIVADDLGDRLRSVVEADDVIQDVMITVYRSLPAVDLANAASFRAWLRTLVARRIGDLHRRHFGTRKRGGPPHSLDANVEDSSAGAATLGERLRAPGPSPSSIASQREVAAALDAVIADLPPAYREVIRMVHVEGLSSGEVAARLGKSPQAAYSLMYRALEAFRIAYRARQTAS